MPEHVHLVVWSPKLDYKIDKFFAGLKRPFSYRVGKSLRTISSPLLKQLTVTEKGKETFRFWQAGPGHDKNIIAREGAAWAIEYCHNNPVKRGLCNHPSEWKWSSWKYYHQRDEPWDPKMPMVSGIPKW
jgi:putative transposase